MIPVNSGRRPGHGTKNPPSDPEKERKASFCEQKEAKKLYHAGPWALSLTQPQAQHKKVFAPLFSKSGHFPRSENPA
jgi:hypothetical protein